ncbi:MAG: alkyl hydroperoxide reductase subunit F, partial [Methylotenera sp.]|nr:alkyl hydroperoxide reductase subunit F [Methylotenera sp.]
MALETGIKTQLQAYLEMLREPIVLAASLDDTPAAKEMHELLEEITSMSDKITLVMDDNARKPSFSVKRAATHTEAQKAI